MGSILIKRPAPEQNPTASQGTVRLDSRFPENKGCLSPVIWTTANNNHLRAGTPAIQVFVNHGYFIEALHQELQDLKGYYSEPDSISGDWDN